MLDRDRHTAEETLIMTSYFYATLAAPGATEQERYYRATRYLSTDIFEKKYVIIPINKQ
jgi:Ulp1 family protease